MQFLLSYWFWQCFLSSKPQRRENRKHDVICFTSVMYFHLCPLWQREDGFPLWRTLSQAFFPNPFQIVDDKWFVSSRTLPISTFTYVILTRFKNQTHTNKIRYIWLSKKRWESSASFIENAYRMSNFPKARNKRLSCTKAADSNNIFSFLLVSAI